MFVEKDVFQRGDTVIIRAHVADNDTQLPVGNAEVSIAVTGPESPPFDPATSNSSGVAEWNWQTQAPNKRGRGGTSLGSYTATVTELTADGYTWDGVGDGTVFTLQ